MSREPAKMKNKEQGSSSLVVYVATAVIIGIVIISYVMISNMIRDKQEQRLSELENSEQQAEEQESILSEIPKEEAEDDIESVSTEMGKTVEESSNEMEEEKNTETNVNMQNETTKTEPAEKNEENISNETVTKEETKDISFAMPIDGEIVRGFAKESLVYSETLQEWIVHQAIDIKANSRDVVKSAADGTVTAIKNDPRYGLTVIIEHNRGFKTVYSNLLTAEFVVEGENVKQGQTLGTVGSSATFEIADEPHLHFEMLKDSEYVDPSIYVK